MGGGQRSNLHDVDHELSRELERLDGRPYGFYKDLRGRAYEIGKEGMTDRRSSPTVISVHSLVIPAEAGIQDMDPRFRGDDEDQPASLSSRLSSPIKKEGRPYKRPSVRFAMDAEQEGRASCSAG